MDQQTSVSLDKHNWQRRAASGGKGNMPAPCAAHSDIWWYASLHFAEFIVMKGKASAAFHQSLSEVDVQGFSFQMGLEWRRPQKVSSKRACR